MNTGITLKGKGALTDFMETRNVLEGKEWVMETGIIVKSKDGALDPMQKLYLRVNMEKWIPKAKESHSRVKI